MTGDTHSIDRLRAEAIRSAIQRESGRRISYFTANKAAVAIREAEAAAGVQITMEANK